MNNKTKVILNYQVTHQHCLTLPAVIILYPYFIILTIPSLYNFFIVN